MTKIKKTIAVCLILLVILSLSACNFPASYQVLTIKVTTGDSFSATIATKTHVWRLSMENDMLIVSEDEKVKLNCMFMTQELMNEHVMNIKTELNQENQLISIEDHATKNGFKYVLVSYRNDDETKTYKAIGWIVGSNTGIVATCHESKDDIDELLEALTFKIKKTEQPDETYYLEIIDKIQ